MSLNKKCEKKRFVSRGTGTSPEAGARAGARAGAGDGAEMQGVATI